MMDTAVNFYSIIRTLVLAKFAPAAALALALVIGGCSGDSNSGLDNNQQRQAAPAAVPGQSPIRDPENTLYLTLKSGVVTIKLRNDLAPNHAARLKRLTREKFYDGLKFHRVIEGFMAQAGDPTGTGTSGSKHPNIKAEFSKLPFTRGIVGMARAGSDDSANSQFFIMLEDNSSLNEKYTVIGEVIGGMKHVDLIARGEPPPKPDIIVTMQVVTDARR